MLNKFDEQKMKYLPLYLEQKGFILEQIERIEKYAIYSKYRKGFKKETFHYEVIMIQSHNGREINGRSIDPTEYYPSATKWGTLGFTCPSLQEAKEKLNKIIENARK